MPFEYYNFVNVKNMSEDEIKEKIEQNYGRNALIYSSAVSSKPIKGFILFLQNTLSSWLRDRI